MFEVEIWQHVRGNLPVEGIAGKRAVAEGGAVQNGEAQGATGAPKLTGEKLLATGILWLTIDGYTSASNVLKVHPKVPWK